MRHRTPTTHKAGHLEQGPPTEHKGLGTTTGALFRQTGFAAGVWVIQLAIVNDEKGTNDATPNHRVMRRHSGPNIMMIK